MRVGVYCYVVLWLSKEPATGRILSLRERQEGANLLSVSSTMSKRARGERDCSPPALIQGNFSHKQASKLH